MRVGLLGGRVDADTAEAASAGRATTSGGRGPEPSGRGGSPVWKWALIGCAAVAAGALPLLGCGLAFLLWVPDHGVPPVRREQSFGGGQVVYWSDDSLAGEAARLGQALQETRYFNGKGEKGVELARVGDTRVVTVYMPSAEIDKPRVQAMMRDYAGVLWAAIAFEGKPVVVRLCDGAKAERASYPVEPCSRSQFGPQCYVYHASPLRAEAERFGRFVAKTGGTDRPSHWVLTRHGRVWAVCPGATGDEVTAEAREGFRQAARQVSDEVFGGEPVELRVFTKQGVETVSAGD